MPPATADSLPFVASFVLSFVGEECKNGEGIDEVRDKAHDKG